MPAATFNLAIEAAATYKLLLNVKQSNAVNAPAVDLTDWQPRMQIRSDAESLGVLLDCRAANGRIAVTNAAAGEITVTLSATDTSRLDFEAAVYDLIITNTVTGEVRRLLQGEAVVSQAITK